MSNDINTIYSNIRNAVNFQVINSPAFDQLINFQNSFLKDLILPSPYQSSTNDFIDNFSAKLIKNILNSAVTDIELIDIFTSILQNYVRILILIFDLPNLSFLEAAAQITNPKNIFYTSLSKKNPPEQYTKIINLFKMKNFYEQITNIFENNKSLSLKHISILIYLLIAVKEKDEKYRTCISFVFQKVISIFKSYNYNDLREIDDKALNSTLDLIFPIELDYFRTNKSLNFQLDTNIIFAQSDILEKRYNGISKIISIIKNVPSAQKQICEIVNEKQILQGILKDFHHSLVNPFVTILIQFIYNELDIKSYLLSFWDISIKQNSSIASEFFAGWKDLISDNKAKKAIFSKYSDDLFEQISNSLNFPEASFPFLNEISVYANENQKDLVFNALFTFSSIQNSDINSIIEIIKTYLPKNSKQTRDRIIKESLEMIENNFHISLARILFSSLQLNLQQSNEYLKSLIIVLNDQNSMEVIDILSDLLMRSESLLDDNQFSKIIEFYIPKIETDSQKISKFFLSTVSYSITNERVYSLEMKKQIYKKICSLQSFDIGNVNLIIMLYNLINIENKNKEKVGIELLWETAFRTKNESIFNFIMGQMTTMQYVETCMKNIQTPGSLDGLYHIIIKLESYTNNNIRTFLNMPLVNKYIDKNFLIPVQITGYTKTTLFLTINTTYEALKSFLSLFLKIDKSLLILSVNGKIISNFDNHISSPITIDLKLKNPVKTPYEIDYYNELPTLILYSNETYKINLTNLLEDKEFGQKVLQILNKMPTLPIFTITFDIDEENDQNKEYNEFTEFQWEWNQYLSYDNPNHLIYHLNTIGNNLIYNDIEWTHMFFNTGGAYKLVDLMLKTKDSPFDLLSEQKDRKFGDKEYLILLFIIKNMLSLKLDDEMNGIIMQIDDNIFIEFLYYASKLIDNENYNIVSYHLLLIIEKITLIRGIKDTKEVVDSYINLLEKTCFHKNKKIRIWATGFVHKKEIQSHNILIQLLPKAIHKNNIDFINSIVSLANETNEIVYKELIWNTILDSTFKYFSSLKIKDVNDIWQNLNTSYPQENFLQVLFSSFEILIHSFESKEGEIHEIPRIDELYYFLFDDIIYNKLIYFRITPKLIDLLNLLIHIKPSLIQETIPRIMKIQHEISQIQKSGTNMNQGNKLPSIENNSNNGPESHIKGLKNLGATCYMASLLQQLYSIPIFRSTLLNLELNIEDDDNNCQDENDNLNIKSESVDGNENSSNNEVSVDNISDSKNENSNSANDINEEAVINNANESNQISINENENNQNNSNVNESNNNADESNENVNSVNDNNESAVSNNANESNENNNNINESNENNNNINENISNANESNENASNNENNSNEIIASNDANLSNDDISNVKPNEITNEQDNTNDNNASINNENTSSTANTEISSEQNISNNESVNDPNSTTSESNTTKENQTHQTESNTNQNSNQVSNTKPSKKKEDYKWLHELQYLFLKMLLYPTSSSFIDPTNFVKEWKGWDGNPINPHHQQDAEEYLSLILTRLEPKLPIIDALFKGKVLNHLQGEGKFSMYQHDSIEDYFNISLEVKGHKNVASSLEAYKTPDRFEGNNQYNTEEMGLIDAIQTHLILNQSPILIIALKRFQFNMKTLVKEKISSKYEFPLSLDISPILVCNENQPSENKQTSSMYELYGVILHLGTGDAGHYISHIRGSDDNWRIFNDTVVEVESVKEMLKSCYGGVESSQIYSETGDPIRFDSGSAYILFYRRNDYDFNCQSGLNEGNLPVSPRLLTRLAEDVRKDILTEIGSSEEYFNFITTIYQDPEFLLSLLSSKSGVSQKCCNIVIKKCIDKCKDNSANFADSILSYYKESSSNFLLNKDGENLNDIISNCSIITIVKEALLSPSVSNSSIQEFIDDLVLKIKETESIDDSNESINKKLNIYSNNVYTFFEICQKKNKQIDTSKSVDILIDFLSKNKYRSIGSIINLIIKMDSNNKQDINNIAKFFTDEMLLNYFIIDESKEFLSLMVKRIKEDPSKLDLIINLSPENVKGSLILSKIFICILASKRYTSQKITENQNYMEFFFSKFLRNCEAKNLCLLLQFVVNNISNSVEDYFDTFIHYSDFLIDKFIFSRSIDVRKNGCSLFLKFILIEEVNPQMQRNRIESIKKSLFSIYLSLIKRLDDLQKRIKTMACNSTDSYSKLLKELPVDTYFCLLTRVVNSCNLSTTLAVESENLAKFFVNTSYSFYRFNEPCFVRKFVLDFIIETISNNKDSNIFFGSNGEILKIFMNGLPFFSQMNNSNYYDTNKNRDLKELEEYSDTYIKFIVMIPIHLFSFFENSDFLFEMLKSKKIVQSPMMKLFYKYFCNYLEHQMIQSNKSVSNFANKFFSNCLSNHLEFGSIIPIKIAIRIMEKNPKLSKLFYNYKYHSTVWSLIYKKINDYINELSGIGLSIDASVFPLMHLLGVFIRQFSIDEDNRTAMFGRTDYQLVSNFFNSIILNPTNILKISINGNKSVINNSKGSFIFLSSFYNLIAPKNIEEIYDSFIPFLNYELGFISHVPTKAKFEAAIFLIKTLEWARKRGLLDVGSFKKRIDNELACYMNYIFQKVGSSEGKINGIVPLKEKKIDRNVLALISKESFLFFKYMNEQSMKLIYEAAKSLMLFVGGVYYFNSDDLINLVLIILEKKKEIPLDWIHIIQLYILDLIKNEYSKEYVDDFISAVKIIDMIKGKFRIEDIPKIDMDDNDRKNQENWAIKAQGGTSDIDYFVVMHLLIVLVPK